MFLKGCETYGMKSQDLFQVNDLYENKNLYMVVDCLFSLGGMVRKIYFIFGNFTKKYFRKRQAQKNGFDGARLGVRVSNENKRNFTPEKLAESNKIIGLQYGSNRGASQGTHDLIN